MGGQVMTFPKSLPPGVTIGIIRKSDRVLIPLDDGGARAITKLRASHKEALAEITFSAAGEYQIIVAGLQQRHALRLDWVNTNKQFLTAKFRIGVSILAVGILWGILIAYPKLAATILGRHAIATFDSRTKESAFLVAKLIDDFSIRLANAPADRRSFDMFRDDYRKVEVELRQLKLRNATRPLNSISTAQVEIMFRMWHRFKEQHQTKDNVSPEFIQEWQKQVTYGLSQILELEERKPKAKT
jgi:hypothetical protein